MTQFIATMAAPYLLVTGTGFLVSTTFYQRMTAESPKSDPVLINLSGAVHFLVGLLVVLQHFKWQSVAEVTVTLIGVAALAKGASLIVVPELALKSAKASRTRLRLAAAGFLLAGGYLGYVGYLA